MLCSQYIVCETLRHRHAICADISNLVSNVWASIVGLQLIHECTMQSDIKAVTNAKGDLDSDVTWV